MKKLFIIQKYVPARSPEEAIKVEKSYPVMEVFLDQDWKKNNPPDVNETKIIGY